MNNNDIQTDERLTVDEVSMPYFRTCNAMTYEWFRQNKFPPSVAFRIGRKILFNKSALEAWIANGGTAAQKQSQAA